MRVLVAVALPEGQDVVEVELEEGASVARALEAARVAERHPGLALDTAGVWGRRRHPCFVLREGDRVEVYRPVRARREGDAPKARRAQARASISKRALTQSAPFFAMRLRRIR